MKIINIAQLKGGVGKTATSVNLAYDLTEIGYKVLLIDNDKQGNTSYFYNRYDATKPGTHTMLKHKEIDIRQIIQNTDYGNLDIITTNMLMLISDREVLLDTMNPQQMRYKNALKQVNNDYDYCIIDNAPSLDISVINALVCADEVIIPIKVDEFCTNGLTTLMEQLEIIKKNFNENLEKVYILFTMVNNTKINKKGIEETKNIIQNATTSIEYVIFDTTIRDTVKVSESTYTKQPLSIYNKKSTATQDYEDLTIELDLMK